MKAMPLAFEDFQGKGALDFSSSSSDSLVSEHQRQQQNWLNNNKEGCCYVGSEPTSVLDSRRSPSPPTSSSTLSSSLGGSNGGGGGTASTETTGVAAAANVSGNPSVEEKCGLGMEDWEGVLPGSPSQEPSILRLIMGDIDDPSVGLNKILQTGGVSHQDMEFNAGFGVVDQAGFGFDPNIDTSLHVTDFPHNIHANNARVGSVANPNHIFSTSPANLLPVPPLAATVFPQQQQQQQQPTIEALDEKPQIFNPQLIIHQNQAQFTHNPALFLPMPYAPWQEHHLPSPLPSKRVNLGPNSQVPKISFPDSGQQELFLRRQQQQQLQMLQQQPRQTMGVPVTATKQKMVNDELANQQLQQAIVDQVFKAAELIETGNPVLAQGILARLNHQLSPMGKPFQRAAFYFKEALQLLLHMNTTDSSALSTYSIIFKISAYKSFSEISPILQFANFTCNQALLEAFEGFDKIHIIDFDIGYGGQWASLMQELVLRSEGPPSLKITAFASPSSYDELELSFTQENLKHFASEINMPFEVEILSLESLNSASWPPPLHAMESEAIAVNLPIASFSNYPSTLPLVLRFVKQLSPKIVVSLDRGCDRADAPFPHHIIHALQSFSGLLESLDAVNMNMDAQQKIERFLLHPSIEKIVSGRHRAPERLPPWRGLFVQSGFAPLTFSNFTESQADCLVQRTQVKGFHVEKRQSSLVLCWQRKELISASAWRC
ncbi:scarecrow-like protein 22 [Mangifera indica]|uniref:scarecrow-like protein 22 n=1 Tax=Mangifera indica TaxID=29780 RepID=UPI001CFA7FA7|nr:scarecrow-like protein 22 [Mangifera indica]